MRGDAESCRERSAALGESVGTNDHRSIEQVPCFLKLIDRSGLIVDHRRQRPHDGHKSAEQAAPERSEKLTIVVELQQNFLTRLHTGGSQRCENTLGVAQQIGI